MRTLLIALACSLVLANPAMAQSDPRADASAHFERGTDLFNEGRYDAALAEFDRAYEIAPALPVLYNLARVHAELGHPVEAARAYQRYLTEGGDTLPAARRTEVEQALARQRDRIGHLRVEANVEGAIVSVDGNDVATTPLTAPIDLGSGSHAIGVRAPGYEGVTREISIAGTVEASLVVELRREIEARGTLHVTASLAGVTVRIDGREVGTTPLAATFPVPIGVHEVSGERPGYLADSRQVQVDEGADVDVALHVEPDPDAPPETMGELTLRVPDAPLVVRIDDEAMLGRELHLRIGVHRITVEVSERTPWTSEITIDRESPLRLAPPLAWLPDERAERIGASEGQRTAGIALVVSGLALLAVGVPLTLWNESEIAHTDAAIVQLNRDYAAMCMPIGPQCDALAAQGAALRSSADTENTLRWVSITTATLGAIAGATGLVLWMTAPSADAIDEAAHAALRVGPASVSVEGTF